MPKLEEQLEEVPSQPEGDTTSGNVLQELSFHPHEDEVGSQMDQNPYRIPSGLHIKSTVDAAVEEKINAWSYKADKANSDTRGRTWVVVLNYDAKSDKLFSALKMSSQDFSRQANQLYPPGGPVANQQGDRLKPAALRALKEQAIQGQLPQESDLHLVYAQMGTTRPTAIYILFVDKRETINGPDEDHKIRFRENEKLGITAANHYYNWFPFASLDGKLFENDAVNGLLNPKIISFLQTAEKSVSHA